ncbi:hypothetical protein [Clostridium oceanicum]|uniref:FG-GAP repeat protein n=1 Tax=Clostridium oceanicum TaxID=1543 RepID=A0ABN1JLP4_9CLOT
MWSRANPINMIKSFLPTTAEILTLDNGEKAIGMVDLDGDCILELVAAYKWQGEIYIIVLKCYSGIWRTVDIVKGKGYNITYFGAAPIISRCKNNLIVGWQVGSIWSDLSVYEWKDSKLIDLIEKNKYYSKIDIRNNKSTKGKNGTYEIALWTHDTGDAYKVKVYRWSNDKFEVVLDVYPYYFRKVANYYKKLLKEKDSTTYWYYLADAQIKVGDIKGALKSIDKALSFKYPYPSKEKLINLKEKISKYPDRLTPISLTNGILQEILMEKHKDLSKGKTKKTEEKSKKDSKIEKPMNKKDKSKELKEEACKYTPFKNVDGIDFSSLKYICSETKRDIKLEKALIKEFDLQGNEDKVKYYYNKVDLNGDGKKEIFAYLVGPFVCGSGGCSAAIFEEKLGEYKLLSRFSLVNNPVIISNNKTKGYKDIIMNVSGGGVESFFALLKYNGTKYPSNPSIEPKVEPCTKVEGIAIVSDDISEDSGIKFGKYDS